MEHDLRSWIRSLFKRLLLMSDRSGSRRSRTPPVEFEFTDPGIGLIKIEMHGGFALSHVHQCLDAINRLYRGVNAYQYYIMYLWRVRRDSPAWRFFPSG